jgi:NAD(P)-dependent dehydrogenase (short-subunit alcohol dehydrogenase family)
MLPCSAHDAYSLSKLCNIVFTLKLADLLKERGSSVTVSAIACWPCTAAISECLQTAMCLHV